MVLALICRVQSAIRIEVRSVSGEVFWCNSNQRIRMEVGGWGTLTSLVDKCTMPPLSKGCDEYAVANEDFVREFKLHLKSSPARMSKLIEAIANFDDRLGGGRVNAEFAASLLLLLYEMRPDTPWASADGFSEYSPAIRKQFKDTFGFDILNKFPNNGPFQTLAREMFVVCMEKLHKKMTKEMWKRQPVALYCYRTLISSWTKVWVWLFINGNIILQIINNVFSIDV